MRQLSWVRHLATHPCIVTRASQTRYHRATVLSLQRGSAVTGYKIMECRRSQPVLTFDDVNYCSALALVKRLFNADRVIPNSCAAIVWLPFDLRKASSIKSCSASLMAGKAIHC